MDIEYWLRKALVTFGSLPEGTVFGIKDLVSGSEWKACSSSDRMLLGREFKNEVRDGRISGILILDTPKRAPAKYKKI
ncbi:MAG: DUF1413 domain-containing protein [Oscillospiraceae bacterium]|nr:DUF1413 domain-containing protein [Oscillospiraceae bacterium]